MVGKKRKPKQKIVERHRSPPRFYQIVVRSEDAYIFTKKPATIVEAVEKILLGQRKRGVII